MNNEEKEKYLYKIMRLLAFLGASFALPVLLSFIISFGTVCANCFNIDGLPNQQAIQPILNFFSTIVYVVQIILCFTCANYIYKILHPSENN